MKLTLTVPLVTASASGRTISGRIVAYNETGITSAGSTRFDPGSITVTANPILNLEHDGTRPIGRAIHLSTGDDAIDAVFKITGTQAGNDSLIEAAEGLRAGFSVGVDVTDHEFVEGVLVVKGATLEHVALVTNPAIKSATVLDVAASTPQVDPETSDAVPAPDTTEPKEETPVADTTTEAVVVEAAAPVYVPVVKVNDGFPYHAQATDRSFFRDMVNARHDPEAASRAATAQRMLIQAAAGDPTTRGTNATLIPAGYRPDLYVGDLLQGAPTVSAFAQYPIGDATPFKVPTYVSSTGLVGDHVEGTNPISGSLSTSEITVSPKAVSGIWNVSREAIDSLNPAIDMIGVAAMREDYTRDLESYVAGIFVAGATAGIAGATTKYQAAVIKNFAAFAATPGLGVAQVFLAGTNLFTWLAGEVDGSGRPLSPFLTPMNSVGQMGVAAGSLSVAGVPVTAAPGVGTAVGLLGLRTAAASFVSPVQSWRWEEKNGPALIQFALFGYVGAAVLRAAALVKYTQTV